MHGHAWSYTKETHGIFMPAALSKAAFASEQTSGGRGGGRSRAAALAGLGLPPLRGPEARLDGAWACLTWWVAQPVAGGYTEMSFKSLPARAFL